MAELPGKKTESAAPPEVLDEVQPPIPFVNPNDPSVIVPKKPASEDELLVFEDGQGAIPASQRELDQFDEQPGVEFDAQGRVQPSFRQDEIGLDEDRSLYEKMKRRFFAEDVPEDKLALERTGAIIGLGVLGAHIGSKVPPGPPLGPLNPFVGAVGAGAIGVFSGVVAPEASMKVAVAFGLIPPETFEKWALPQRQLQTIVEGEVLLEVALGGTLGVIREIARVGGRVFSGVGATSTPFSLGKRGLEGEKLAETAARKFNIHLMPVMVGGRQISRGYVTVFGRFPLIAGPLKKTGEKINKQVKTLLSSLGPRIAPLASFSDISLEILGDAQLLVGKMKTEFGRRYTAIFKRADELGVIVKPIGTSLKAREILAEINKMKTIFADKSSEAGPVLEKLEKFLVSSILPIERAAQAAKEVPTRFVDEFGRPIVKVLPARPKILADQTLQSMDGTLSKIDEFMTTLEPGQQKHVLQFVAQLKQAAQLDVMKNTMLTAEALAAGGNPKSAAVIGQALRKTDVDFSHTMAELFETATAKRFATPVRKGLRGVTKDSVTRTPVDQLAKLVVQMESPQTVQELAKLVTPQTYKRIVANVIDTAVEDSLEATRVGLDEIRTFNVDKFVKRLGIGKEFGNRRKVVAEMLEQADSPFKMKDFDELVRVLDAVGSVDIPNVSTFVARRAMLGGFKSAMGAFLPTATGAAVGSGKAGIGTLMLSTILFVGGGKILSRMLAKPETARALRNVVSEETSMLVKRRNTIQALRGAIVAERSEGSLTFSEAATMLDRVDLLFRHIDAELGIDVPFVDVKSDFPFIDLESDEVVMPEGGLDISDSFSPEEIEEDRINREQLKSGNFR